MNKNTAGQKFVVFAFNRTTNVPLTGDAANITANLQIDFATAAATNDVNPTELEDGYYAFDAAQAETNGNALIVYPASSTADIQVIAVPGVIYTTPVSFADDAIQTGDSYAIVNDSGFGNSALNDSIGNIAPGVSGGGAVNASGATITTGTETLTYTATLAQDGILHEVAPDVGNTDFEYTVTLDANELLTEVFWRGSVNSNGDQASLELYNWITTSFVPELQIVGNNSSSLLNHPIPAIKAYTGTGANIGKVRFRLVSTNSTNIATDRVRFEFTTNFQSAGYALGRVWVRTLGGLSGTVPFFNGVVERPCLLWSDAVIVAPNIEEGLTDFHIVNGSLVVLVGVSDKFSIFGDNWTLQLNGKSVDNAYIQGAKASGVGLSPNGVHYEGGEISNLSVQKGHFDFCSFENTITMTLAGDYRYHNCYSNKEAVGGPIFTKTLGQTISGQWRGWKGSLTLSNIQAGDGHTISGPEIGDIILNGVDGTVKILGQYESLTDNRTTTGSRVLIEGAFQGSDVTDILADTADIQPKIGTPSGTLSADIASVKGDSTSIKTTTDKFAFTVANQVDSNMLTHTANIPANYITAAGIATSALDNKGNWNTTVPPSVIAIRQEMDTNSVDLNTLLAGQTTINNNVVAVGTTLDAVAIVVNGIKVTTDKFTFTVANQVDSNMLSHTANIPSNYITAAGIAANALDGKGNWNTGKTGYALSATGLDAISSTSVGMVEIAKAIWDRILTGETHNITNSAGKKVRQVIDSVVIFADNAQSSAGLGPNQVKLSLSASSDDGAYDPANVTIAEGTGRGQTRLIIEYDGATRIATVDRNWKTTLDTTSITAITANSGREHVNEGLAQAGTSNSITLNNLASSVDNAYRNQTVFIRSGPGSVDDQARIVLSYDGTTKIAIVDKTWDVIPGNQTGYVMLPRPVRDIADIVTAMLTTQMTESYAANGVAPTLEQVLFAIQQFQHAHASAGTTKTVKGIDGITTVMTFTYDDVNPSALSRTT